MNVGRDKLESAQTYLEEKQQAGSKRGSPTNNHNSAQQIPSEKRPGAPVLHGSEVRFMDMSELVRQMPQLTK